MRRVSPYWVPLDGAGVSPERVGGKAAALDRLIRIGAPVPRTAVLVTDAYRRFLQASSLRHDLERLQTGDAADDDLAPAFAAAPLETDVVEAIHQAFEYATSGRTVAVRSSGTAEDTAAASFAGQYDTFLQVPAEDVEARVRACWASLWSQRARSYRKASGVSDEGLAMAVIIQRMVDAAESGVVFTVDPTDPESRLARVEIVAGLGERLVSGRATPHVYRVTRDGRLVGGGDAPPYLASLVEQSLEIEAAFSGPQDIEWSVAGGKVFVLQARPITTLAGRWDAFDTTGPLHATFSCAGIAEMLPGVVPPLLWTMNGPLINDAFSHMYRRLGVGDSGNGEPMVGRFRGRAALSMTRLKQAARLLPRGSAAEVERCYLGYVATEGDEPPLRLVERLGRAVRSVRSLGFRSQVARDAAAYKEVAALVVDMDVDYEGLPLERLVEFRQGIRRLAALGYRTEVAVAAAAAADYEELERLLTKYLGDASEGFRTAQRLTSGVVWGEDPGDALAQLGLSASDLPLEEVAATICSGPVETIARRLAGNESAGAQVVEALRARARRAGSTAIYGGPTWAEQPELLWSLIRRRLRPRETQRSDPAELLAEVEHRVTRTPQWRRFRILTGQIVDIRLRLLRRLVADASAHLRLREEVKAALLRLGGVERRVVLVLIDRLDIQRRLGPGDELLLSDAELDAWALGAAAPSGELLTARRRHHESQLRASRLPDLFEPAGLAGGGTTVPPSRRVEAAGVWRGMAASPGRVEGRAHVASTLEEAAGTAEGAIVVGHATSPAWTPYLLGAGGIVMEEGGPLSHAAIVAREFAIPAVLGVSGITEEVRTGMTVAVDGGAGTVEIREREPVGVT
jgi:pyruvate,water dikinase